MTAVRYDITFTGRVQGVGFRATTCAVAGRCSVVGWVRNEPDGSVHCVAEGEADELDAFIRAMRTTMDRYISNVDINKGDATGEFTGFSMRY